jgi:hypothetical protein
MHHPFSGNYTCKFNHHETMLESALQIQPLPWSKEGPHHLGLFTSEDPYTEPVPLIELHTPGPTALKESSIPLLDPSSLPTPPMELHSTMSSAEFRAMLVNLDTSLSNWRVISLKNMTPRPAKPPGQHPSKSWPTIHQSLGLQALTKSVSLPWVRTSGMPVRQLKIWRLALPNPKPFEH